MHEVEAISFRNKEGLTLFGTLHVPERPVAQLPVVVMLSPGVKMRVGPGRLYVPLTQMLLDGGYTVLRFDFFGLGDSEGELSEPMLADIYNNIEVGRYVDDTLCALEWLRARGHQKFILGGLCGGAITGLLAAQRDPSVVGLLSLGMTTTLASNSAVPGKYLTRHQLDRRREKYLRKIFSLRSWLRFLSFKSDYETIWYSMKRVWAPNTKPPAPSPASPATEQRGNANPLFPPAYFTFLERGGQVLMLFSEKDRLVSDYEEKFVEKFAARLEPFNGQIHQHVIRNANHVMTLQEWQREMVDVCRTWMQARHAA